MNKLIIAGIVIILILIAGTYAVVGDMMGGDIVNILAMSGAAAIAIIAIFVVLKYVRQMQNDTATGDLAQENWDGIGEYMNELPIGWSLSILGLIIWGGWYMMAGYPLHSYSQIGEYNEDVAKANEKAAAKYAEMSDTKKLKMGQGLFSVNCAPCHGPQGNGQEMLSGPYAGNLTAEDLTKRHMSSKYVAEVIRNGSNQLGYPGGMPAGMLYEDADVELVAQYVANGMSGEGSEKFVEACSGCHGAMGEGMDYVAPSLKNYNQDLVRTLLSEGMKKGDIGIMPAFKSSALTADQVDALARFVEYGVDKEIEE